ncbi:response regulator transcription factor [Anaerobacillus sp. CMMVII]|uniref:response regulator transcription factor n=1 Tax=Anaerobacillus sp. CMMVII TaxID=2755588 RepID=UPI0021B778A8|nr:response regulator [Anaerobacillus sp. CMMVII]MCT8137005.1 response regulator transcription factor [Anaerobacillus sp. CMMVII]
MEFIEEDIKKIALLEDEPSHALLISYNLESRGVRVSLFESAEQFLNCSQKSFDLIIINVNLHDVNGLQLCSDIRKKGIDTPILFVKTSPSINKCLCADNNLELLIKPFSIKDLLLKVNQLLTK